MNMVTFHLDNSVSLVALATADTEHVGPCCDVSAVLAAHIQCPCSAYTSAVLTESNSPTVNAAR